MSNKRTLGRGLHSLIPEVDDNDKKLKVQVEIIL